MHELQSPHFNVSKVKNEVLAIEDKTILLKRVDSLFAVLQKSDERIHDWRTIAAQAWGAGAFSLAMVLLGTFLWSNESRLNKRIRELEESIDA